MRLSYSLQKFGQSIFFKVIFDLKMVKEVKGMCENFFLCKFIVQYTIFHSKPQIPNLFLSRESFEKETAARDLHVTTSG